MRNEDPEPDLKRPPARTDEPEPPRPGSPENHYRPVKNPVIRTLLLTVGWISVVLGVMGILLPLLPTTPFLLLAAACFLRSSRHFYDWLVRHPRLGRYIRYYLDGEGMPRRAKVYTLALIWGTMSLSAWFLQSLWIALILLVIALAVSFYIARLPVTPGA